MTPLEPRGDLAPDLAAESQPESVLCKCSCVCAASQTPAEPTGRGRRSPVKTPENFRWQRGMLHQLHSSGNFQLVFAFYCKARDGAKTKNPQKNQAIQKQKIRFKPLTRTLLTGGGPFS